MFLLFSAEQLRSLVLVHLRYLQEVKSMRRNIYGKVCRDMVEVHDETAAGLSQICAGMYIAYVH